MKVNTLTLRNYRNYKELTLELSPNINVFLGENAQGKTNVVEAVYYAAMGHSHRTNTDVELIRWEEAGGSIRLDFERLGVANLLEFQFSREKRRQILSNGQSIRTKDLIGALNAVLFSPEDLFLIKGAPAGRRKYRRPVRHIIMNWCSTTASFRSAILCSNASGSIGPKRRCWSFGMFSWLRLRPGSCASVRKPFGSSICWPISCNGVFLAMRRTSCCAMNCMAWRKR